MNSLFSPPNNAAARPSARLDHNRLPTSDDGSDVLPTVPLDTSGNLRPGRARTLQARLSGRDLAILQTLADFRLMTGRQLQRLHLDGSNPTTIARRGRAVLQRLWELRAVVRLDRRIGGVRAGSDGLVYGLSGLGLAVLALEQADGSRPGGRMVWETKPAFQDHLLAIGDLYVELHELQQAGQLEVLDFHTEPRAWRWFSGAAGERQTVKPDAFAALGIGEFEQRMFIEIDCGTESLPTIARKCRRYGDYWQSGDEQRQHGVFPKVWWLASSPRRAARLADVVATLPAEHQQLFGVGLAAEAAALLSQPATAGDAS
jgi:hypothetical protein